MEFDPKFINVTYHREEYITNKAGQLVSNRKRPGTVAICAALKHKYKVETIPHLICGGFTREETEYALIDAHYLGIHNVLALRGDPAKIDGKTEKAFTPNPDGNTNSIDLIKQIDNLNHSKYLHEEMEGGSATDFCIGVSGYPEKHFEADSLDTDIAFLKQKVDAGADFVITQLFFDNSKFISYVEKCRAMGINIPIIPGLKPITTLKQIELLPKVFFIQFPAELQELLDRCKTDADVKEVGIDWSIKQAKELCNFGVPTLHYYTMGKSEAVKRILREVL